MASSSISIDSANKQAAATISRNGTNMWAVNGPSFVMSSVSGQFFPCAFFVIDIPGSVSPLTYAVQIKSVDGATVIEWPGGGTITQSIVAVEFQ